MLAQDLEGLGVAPLQAARTANGGIGPLTITPVGTTFASAPRIGATQYLVTASNFASGLAVALPPIGGDMGGLIADQYVINNQGTSSLLIIASTSVLISMAGSLSSIQRAQSHSTCVISPVATAISATAANWIGVSGQ